MKINFQNKCFKELTRLNLKLNRTNSFQTDSFNIYENYRVFHETWQLMNSMKCFLPYFVKLFIVSSSRQSVGYRCSCIQFLNIHSSLTLWRDHRLTENFRNIKRMYKCRLDNCSMSFISKSLYLYKYIVMREQFKRFRKRHLINYFKIYAKSFVLVFSPCLKMPLFWWETWLTWN